MDKMNEWPLWKKAIGVIVVAPILFFFFWVLWAINSPTTSPKAGDAVEVGGADN